MTDKPDSLHTDTQSTRPSLEDLRRILKDAKIIAVVGLSDKPDRPSHTVPAYLQQQGYRIIPVNPMVTEVLGEKSYASLRDVPGKVDVVDIFRKAEDVPPVIDDAILKGVKVVWMQLGIVNEEAAAKAEAAGIEVVMDTCIGATHRKLREQGQI
jgi:predicted CoA-binding protein